VIDVSICIVSLDCWEVLRDCLESLRASRPSVNCEVILVDNGSSDGTIGQVRESFPEVVLVENGRNVGFTRATNQAIALSSGRYILWLNPDTVLKPDSLHKLYQFMEATPRCGIAGPKVLNPDGSFQPQCKRGAPTPIASLCHTLKLNHLWSRNRVIGQYLLSYLPNDRVNQVDAVSGCCLMARREAWNDIGPLDEKMFGFGEDLDWCLRAKKAGWVVWYYPESTITHLKGQGGAHARPFHKIWGIHQAMWVIYRKHFRSSCPLVTWLMWIGIGTSVILSWSGAFFKRGIRRLITG